MAKIGFMEVSTSVFQFLLRTGKPENSLELEFSFHYLFHTGWVRNIVQGTPMKRYDAKQGRTFGFKRIALIFPFLVYTALPLLMGRLYGFYSPVINRGYTDIFS
jgi:hypothetical protein